MRARCLWGGGGPAALWSRHTGGVQIVRSGQWLYDGVTLLPVDIFSLDRDFWYDLAAADDQLEPDEEPTPLNPDGVLFYYRFVRAGEDSEHPWPDSGGYATIEAAMAAAQERAPSQIEWHEPTDDRR
jgi:hypothetical protein